MRFPACFVAATLVLGCGGEGSSADGIADAPGGTSGADGSQAGSTAGGGSGGGFAGTSGAAGSGNSTGGSGVSDAGANDSGTGLDSGMSDAAPLDGGDGNLPVLPSAGCGKSGAAIGPLPGRTSSVNGVPRSYDLFVPSAYDETRPVALVFTYHGAGGTANTNQFKFDDFSDDHGGMSIQVAPQGWGTPQWDQNHFVPFNLDDSLQLFDQVLDELAGIYCIDLNRVFAMGQSNGGQMAFHLGCLRGDKLRAVMPNAGRCFSYGPGVCDPEHSAASQQCPGPVMVLSVMGEDDTSRHADEAATVEGFRQRAGCSSDTEPRDPSPCQRFTGCAANAEVATCRIPGLGHSIWRDGRADVYDYMLSL